VAARPESERIERLKRELQLLEGQFTSRYPDVVRLKTEIAGLERQQQDAMLRDAERAKVELPTVARRKSVQGLGDELERLKAEESSLRENIANVEKRLEDVPAREQEFGRITRDYQGSKDLYDSLLKRYKEAQVGESMEVDRQGEHFRILEAALPPSSPVAPNRLRLLAVGLLMAIAAGIGAALLAEQFDATFHSSEALREFTSVPVLATIPIITYGKRRTRALRLTLAAASVLAAIALAAVMSAHMARGNEQIVWMLARGA